jgi:hypothetical protein
VEALAEPAAITIESAEAASKASENFFIFVPLGSTFGGGLAVCALAIGLAKFVN